MAKNDFKGEVPVNYAEKCLCVLVLDVSGSMDGEPIDELNKGLQEFYDDISNNPSLRQGLEVSIITFNHIVKTIQEPALVDQFEMPKLSASGCTAMVNAVNAAIDKVEARKQWYKDNGMTYKRPWIILMTDGEPDDDQDVNALASRIKDDTVQKHYQFLPIGVEDANMSILGQIQGNMKPKKLKGTRFSDFFEWLSNSMGSVIDANQGDKIQLGDTSDFFDDWLEV